MPKIEWWFEWSINRGGSGEDPHTIKLKRFTGVANDTDEVIGRLASMTLDYGPPEYIEHVDGPGILWPNGGAWGIWVMKIVP